VTLEEANARATELNIMFMETSAKAGHNVKSLFKKIAMSLVGMEKEGEASLESQQNTSTFRPSFSCSKDLDYVSVSQKSTLRRRMQMTYQMLHNVNADSIEYHHCSR
jgi:hypothetical protein